MEDHGRSKEIADMDSSTPSPGAGTPLGPGHAAPAGTHELGVDEMLRFCWENRWLMALTTAVSVAVAFLLPLVASPRYEAVATVMVAPATFSSELKQPAFTVEAYGQIAQLSFVLNRTMERAGVDSTQTTDITFNTVLYPSRKPDTPYLPLLGLRAESGDPALAQGLANAWAELFLQEARRLSLAGSATSVDFILTQYPTVSSDLQQAETKLAHIEVTHGTRLAELRAELGLLPLPRKNEVIETTFRHAQLVAAEERVVQLEGRLQQVALEVLEAKSEVAQLETELRDTPPVLEISKAITDDALWEHVGPGAPGEPAGVPVDLSSARLRSQEINPVFVELSQRLAGARVRFGSLQPLQADLADQLAATRGQADRLRTELLEGLTAIDKLVREQRLEIAPQLRSVNEARLRFNRLEAEVAEAFVAKAETDSDIKIGALADLPAAPMRARSASRIVGAPLAGLLVGVLLAWARSVLRTRVPGVGDTG